MKLTIRELRRMKDISQEAMAEACGVHVNTYRAWEENPAKIRIENVSAIAKALDVPVEDIFLSANTT